MVEIIEEALDAVALKLRLPGASGFLAGQHDNVSPENVRTEKYD